MKKLVLLGVLALIGLTLCMGCAKSVVGTGVYGKIMDKETKKPVEGATITVTALKQVSEASPQVWAVTGTSDKSGSYSITPLDPGNYAVTVTAPGYFAYSLSQLTIKKDKMKKLDIALEPSFIGG